MFTITAKRRVWWVITITYIGITYATLGIMPTIWNRINAFCSGKGIYLLNILYISIIIALLIYLRFMRHDKTAKRYILLILFIIIFFLMYLLEKNPGEKIHMAQYGLLGVLVFYTLKGYFEIYNSMLYVYGSLICITAGAFDEIIQWIIPNRCFTWHDVLINGASGALVLLFIRFNLLQEKPDTESPNLNDNELESNQRS